ncbi:MAG: hypothetical protein H0V22_08990 [Solirubrobacterales bacterium]|nr:hypothetical protein [Solirubrobacterales bacterium]
MAPRRPERVLVSGLGYQLLVPEQVLPFAGLLAVGVLAAARPPRVSLSGLTALLELVTTNFFTTTVEDAVFTMGLAIGAWARRGGAQPTPRHARGDAPRGDRGAGAYRSGAL